MKRFAGLPKLDIQKNRQVFRQTLEKQVGFPVDLVSRVVMCVCVCLCVCVCPVWHSRSLYKRAGFSADMELLRVRKMNLRVSDASVCVCAKIISLVTHEKELRPTVVHTFESKPHPVSIHRCGQSVCACMCAGKYFSFSCRRRSSWRSFRVCVQGKSTSFFMWESYQATPVLG